MPQDQARVQCYRGRTGHSYSHNNVSGSARVQFGDTIINQVQGGDEKLFSWLSSLNPWAAHDEARQQVSAGTVDWLFNDETFLNWLRGDNDVLWCPGAMGAGKTVLFSAVVDFLRKEQDVDGTLRMAFIYCQYSDRGAQTVRSLFGSLLSQLLRQDDEQEEILETIRNTFKRQPSLPPTVHELQSWLQACAKTNAKTLILLDGMDELEQGRRDELVNLLRLPDAPNVKLLITSRDYPEIRESLGRAATLTIRVSEEQVRAHIAARWPSVPRRLRAMISTEEARDVKYSCLEEEITATIAHRADGMFLLGTRQLDLVMRSRTVPDVFHCLDNLPDSLDAYYDQTWDRVTSSENDLRDVAYTRQILTWIIYTDRPLFIPELQHAVAISCSDTNERLSMIPQEWLVELCGGFVALSDGYGPDKVARLIHFSTKQYLEKRNFFISAKEHMKNFHKVWTSRWMPRWKLRDPGWNLDFLPDDPLEALSLSELFSRTRLQPNTCEPQILSDLTQLGYSRCRLMYQPAMFLLCEPDDGIFSPVRALVIAMYCKLYHTVKALLLFGVSPNFQFTLDWFSGSPLHCLATVLVWYPDEVIAWAELLVQLGADVDAKDCNGRSPAHLAAGGDNYHYYTFHYITFLIENGADLSVRDQDGQTVLMYAAGNYREKALRLLLQHETGAAEPVLDDGNADASAVKLATSRSLQPVNKAALDVNATDERGLTALMHAASEGAMVSLDMLLDYGADASMVDAEGLDALQFLLTGERWMNAKMYKSIQRLVQLGANINATNERGVTTLMEAMRCEHKDGSRDMIRFLLEQGADIFAVDESGYTALDRIPAGKQDLWDMVIQLRPEATEYMPSVAVPFGASHFSDSDSEPDSHSSPPLEAHAGLPSPPSPDAAVTSRVVDMATASDEGYVADSEH